MTLAAAAWWTSQVSAVSGQHQRPVTSSKPRAQKKRAWKQHEQALHMAAFGSGAPQPMDCRDQPIGRGPSRPTPRDGGGATSSSSRVIPFSHRDYTTTAMNSKEVDVLH